MHLLKLRVHEVHLDLQILEIVAHLLTQLALLLPTEVLVVSGLVLEQLANGFEVGLPVVNLFLVVLLLADDNVFGEVLLVFEVACVEQLLQLANQQGFLMIVVGDGEVDDLLEGVGNNCDDEVHENHGESDYGEDVHEEGQVNFENRVLEAYLFVLVVQQWIIKAMLGTDQTEISHRRSQSGQQQRQPWVDSAVPRQINVIDSEADRKAKQENQEQQEEVLDVFDHLKHHHRQEAELVEHPDQVKNLDQRKHGAHHVQEPN